MLLHQEILVNVQGVKVFPLDTYFYSAYAVNILRGEGPQSSWPTGPSNKYFPGYSYWWSLFLEPQMSAVEATRHFVAPQMLTILMIMICLVILGRLLWHDWPLALGFAALTSCSPMLLKWLTVPMAEPFAGLCVTACAASAVVAWRHAPHWPQSSPARYSAGLAGLSVFGALGFFTRMEVAYVIGCILLIMFVFKRVRWSWALLVVAIMALPVAIWQMWLYRNFGQRSSYVAEGATEFNSFSYFQCLVFLIEFFPRVANVHSYLASIDLMMLIVSIIFFASLVTALRGYLGRLACLSAWICLGYWVLHALWYYQAERYNLIILPFGYIVFFEGLGRLYNWKNGWRARGALVFLVIFCLIFVPYYRAHADMTVAAQNKVLNQQVLPQ